MHTLLLLALLAGQQASDVVVDVDKTVITGADAVVVDTPLAEVVPPTDQEILSGTVGDVVKVATNWKALGGLGAAALIIAILIRLSKLGALARLLEQRNAAWLRPVLSVVLGGLGCVVTAIQQGTRDVGGVVAAFLAGGVAGLVGIGGYELARLSSPAERARLRTNGEDLYEATQALEDRVMAAAKATGDDVGTIRSQVAAATKLPNNKRVETLAKLSRKQRR